jgi:hypothetical protein
VGKFFLWLNVPLALRGLGTFLLLATGFPGFNQSFHDMPQWLQSNYRWLAMGDLLLRPFVPSGPQLDLTGIDMQHPSAYK